MAERADDVRAAAIRDFAARLRRLREAAGTPSFREMSGRSKAISHTTLHEAAQGNRLPSWATTVEFAKACGADPTPLRSAWERADAAVRAGSRPGEAEPPPPAEVPAPVEVPTSAAPGAPVEVDPATPAPPRSSAPPSPPPARRRRRVLAGGAAAVVVVAGVTATVLATRTGDDGGTTAAPTGSTPTTSAPVSCPLPRTDPPSAPPANDGDIALYVSDPTLPDCSDVPSDATLTKTWRFKNIGTVTWRGYSLRRIDLPEGRDQCQTIVDIPIPETAPGGTVDISTSITTPSKPGFCYARFKFEDGDGRVAFPGSRPVTFQLYVR